MAAPAPEHVRNIVLVGQDGAGKTSLAEAMLFVSGKTPRMGTTHDGKSYLDYDPEEIKRKFTISTSIAPIPYKDYKINVLDTSGHPDFIGDTLDMAASAGFEDVLLVGHVGKLCKLAGGIMNTHSHTADCRTELFCTHAALCGASRETCRALFEAATTDACLDLLDAAGLRAPVLESLLAAVQLHLDRRAAGAFRVGAILFSNQHGPLGQTETAAQILNDWKER